MTDAWQNGPQLTQRWLTQRGVTFWRGPGLAYWSLGVQPVQFVHATSNIWPRRTTGCWTPTGIYSPATRTSLSYAPNIAAIFVAPINNLFHAELFSGYFFFSLLPANFLKELKGSACLTLSMEISRVITWSPGVSACPQATTTLWQMFNIHDNAGPCGHFVAFLQ